MKKLLFLIAIAALALTALAGSAGASHGGTRPAFAKLHNADGEVVGFAFLREDREGVVRIHGLVRGLTPGLHGTHIHAVGNCTPPGFTSAGGHYNPLGRQHGLLNPSGPHAGDLPNLSASSIGLAHLKVTTDRVTLSPGPATLFDADGSALVVHASEDDQVTDPTGNSGGRVACGVIEPFPLKGGLSD